jgi:hypothetical protein
MSDSESDPLIQEEKVDDSTSSLEEKSFAKDDAVGAKNIGRWGSFVYIINQIFGPGVLAIPIVFQQGMIDFISHHT